MQSNAGSSAQAEAGDVDVEMTSPPSDSQSDDDVRRLVDEYLAEHGDDILPLKPEDIRSMLPCETMNSFALRALTESMTLQAWGQGSRQARGQDKAKPIQQLPEHISRQADEFDFGHAVQLLKPEADGSQKIVKLVGDHEDKARCLAIFSIGPSNCEVALIGTSDDNRFMQEYLRDIRQRIPPHERCPWAFKEYNVQISEEEAGPWTCSRESELGLVLAGAFLDCLLYGFESLSDRDTGREAYDTRKISHDCLRHFLPGLQLLVEEEEEEEGDGNNGHQIDDEEEDSDESDDSDDSDEEDDSDGEDDDQIEDANDCDGDNITKDEKEEFEKFDFDKIIGNMSMIDMEDKDDVEKRIKSAITPLERKCMELSREIEEMIISALPTNEKVVNDMENDADIKRFVEAYRQHVRTLIKSLAQFMLAAVSHDELPPCMRGWFVYIMANATEECRERLLNLLTHPSIQLLAIQYLLGQPVWWPSMFDSIKHRIDLEKSKESDDAVTAYIAIGHLSEAIHYLYNGSGTSLSPTVPLIGEAARMAGHNKALALSLEEMVRRRRAIETSFDKSILVAHTLLARSKEYFFLPFQRYPVDTRDPTDPVPGTCAALALYAENLNAILFSSCAVNHVPRSASAEPFIRISRSLIKKLRGTGLPDSPWNGANVVLPISQVPRAMWKLMKANLRVEISSACNDKLRQYFAENGKATLRRSVCLAMLDSEDLPLADPYVKALRLLYADILTEHGLKYRTYHEDKTLRLIVLWVAIIHEAESCSLVTPPDDDDDDDDDDEHNDRYRFEDDTLDWTNVSVKAREVAPFDLRDDYSEDGCRKLYNAGKSMFFNRNVLLRSNWNRLRHGLPKKISKSSSMMRHPVFIKARIRHICQVFVYQHMDIGGLIRESSSMIRIKPNAKTPRALFTRVVDQLRQDISLCNSVQVAHGAWEDAALEALINGELFRACKLLEGGLTWAVASNWERLEELNSEWAVPRDSSITVITDVKAQQGLRHWDPNSLPADHDDNDDKLQRLLENHTKPAEVFQAKERASQHRSEARAAAASATKDSEANGDDDDDDDDVFELWDRDYEPLKTRLFSVKKARARQSSQGRSAPSKAKASDAVRRVPPNTGTCSQCGAVSSNLSEHKKNCRGRCHRCHFGACIPDPHGPACLSCKAKGFKHCKYPSKSKKEQTVLCHQCKRYIPQDTMRHHKNTCRGRCKPCQDAGKACAPTTGPSTKCQRCKETPGNLECVGFSHQHLIEQGAEEKCKKCHVLYRNVKTHEITCKGRCQRCRDLKKGCGLKTSAGCATCKADKVTCPRNYSERAEEKREKCPRCDADGLILKNHEKYCPGKCPGCVKAKKPCVPVQGDTTGRCARCRDENIAVCGKKNHEHRVEKVNCPDCGNAVPRHTFSRHKGYCPGKCTNCRKKGIPCKRPSATASLEACDGCKEPGKDGKKLVCDGKWRKALKGKEKAVEDLKAVV